MKLKEKKIKKLELFIKFLIFGIIVGVIEDLIAVKLATGAVITWTTVGIIVLVTIPLQYSVNLLLIILIFLKNFIDTYTASKKEMIKNQKIIKYHPAYSLC